MTLGSKMVFAQGGEVNLSIRIPDQIRWRNELDLPEQRVEDAAERSMATGHRLI